MAALLLFSTARDAAGGTSRVKVDALTVGAVLVEACERLGPRFAAVLDAAQVWVDGHPLASTTLEHPVGPETEVAIIPPVAGG